MVLLRCRSIFKRICRQGLHTKSSSEVRRLFFEYFKGRDHVPYPSSSVVPSNDPSLLFVNAGMNQFKSIILGTAEPDSAFGQLRRVVNAQKCIRAGGKKNDLDDVGYDTSHHTFFEMLGNWSFGDYYKKEACLFAWEFLTGVLRIPPNRLYVTYFCGDDNLGVQPDLECREIWQNIGVPENRILPFGEKDNFWQMGETGPCGTCSEIHYDYSGNLNAGTLVNKAESPVVELWNLVFMEYNRDSTGNISRLPKRHIDCGMGFERLVAIMQNVQSNYDTDIFIPLISTVVKYCNVGNYGGKFDPSNRRDAAFRIVADHLRAFCIGISDGVIPGVTGRGHVLRHILRRAALLSENVLHAERGLLHHIVPFFIDHLTRSFPELAEQSETIQSIVKTEESTFWKLVIEGKKLVQDVIDSLPSSSSFPGDAAYRLHDTYGIPLDITKMIAGQRNMIVDVKTFEECRRHAREESVLGAKLKLKGDSGDSLSAKHRRKTTKGSSDRKRIPVSEPLQEQAKAS